MPSDLDRALAARTRNGMFVDGEWRRTSVKDPQPVVNPATEEVVAEIDVAGAEDVATAVEIAEAAANGSWATMSVAERCEIAYRIREGLEARREELVALAVTTLGQPIRFARGLGGALQFIDSFVSALGELTLEYERKDDFGRSLIVRRPVGVVAAIVPWNTPLRSEVKKVVPALLAGCTVVLKPAPATPFAAEILAEVALAAGAPAGVLNVVHGGAETGRALVEHPKVQKVAFTGSTATGAWIGGTCGTAMKRMQLELGGKSAAVLLLDADLDVAIPAIVDGNFRNTGQTCVATTRVIAPAALYDEVCERIADGARAQVVGDPFDEATTVGPLVSEAQRRRVLGYVERGEEEGARRLTVANARALPPRGWYVEPTVFGDVTTEMTIAQEEIFGPVASVTAYASVEEAVQMANASQYGLHGSVYSRDEASALEVARRLETGTVGINQMGLPASAPFGGVKMSGVGREQGAEGFDEFLEYRSYGFRG